MNLLILGSQGFIGSHLANLFISKGFDVTGCDLVETGVSSHTYHKISILSPDFDTVFTSKHFDVCINASGSGNVSFSVQNPSSDFEANTAAVSKVLDTIRKYNPGCKYLHISSAAVYGNPKMLPLHENDTLAPLSPYGYHKWISEILCQEYHTLYALQIAIVRPFSVYGPGLKKQLLWDICNKLTISEQIELFGSGSESRDFIHVDDLSVLIMSIVEKCNFKCTIYNAASGMESTIREIADIFESNFQPSRKISFSGLVRTGDPINWRADISLARGIGYTPTINLTEGIAGYIRWFQSLSN